MGKVELNQTRRANFLTFPSAYLPVDPTPPPYQRLGIRHRIGECGTTPLFFERDANLRDWP